MFSSTEDNFTAFFIAHISKVRRIRWGHSLQRIPVTLTIQLQKHINIKHTDP